MNDPAARDPSAGPIHVRRRSPRRSGNATSCIAPRASPTSSTSTCTWCTRSRAPRRSTGSACTAVRCAAPISPSRRWITTCPRRPVPSPIDHASARWTRCRRTPTEFGVTLFPMGSPGQGIVHVIGPEQGYTQPGLVIVCGDSHTSTHGAFGALAFGIGTSEVEHVLATQTLPQTKPGHHGGHGRRRAAGRRRGEGRHPGIINAHRHGRRRRPHHRVPRLGHPRALDGGPHDDLQHVDRGRRPRGHGRARRHDVRLRRGPAARAARAPAWERALDDWRSLPTDDGASFDKEVTLDAAELRPYVTWGTNPAQSVTIDETVPDPEAIDDAGKARGRRPRARVHGPRARHAHPRDPARHHLHRLVHELPDRGPARRRRGGRRAQGRRRPAGAGRPRLVRREAAGGARGPGRGVLRRGVRMARRRLFDVPGHEPRHPVARATAARAPATGTSRDARARAAARTWSARPSPPPPRSPDTSRPPRTSRWNRSA